MLRGLARVRVGQVQAGAETALGPGENDYATVVVHADPLERRVQVLDEVKDSPLSFSGRFSVSTVMSRRGQSSSRLGMHTG